MHMPSVHPGTFACHLVMDFDLWGIMRLWSTHGWILSPTSWHLTQILKLIKNFSLILILKTVVRYLYGNQMFILTLVYIYDVLERHYYCFRTLLIISSLLLHACYYRFRSLFGTQFELFVLNSCGIFVTAMTLWSITVFIVFIRN